MLTLKLRRVTKFDNQRASRGYGLDKGLEKLQVQDKTLIHAYKISDRSMPQHELSSLTKNHRIRMQEHLLYGGCLPRQFFDVAGFLRAVATSTGMIYSEAIES
jgi:hypothetical protein